LEVGNYTLRAGVTVLPGEVDEADNTYIYGWISVVIAGDLNCDMIVNVLDLAIVALAYGCKPGDENWNANADVNCDGVINVIDLAAVAIEYGKSL